jgi:leucyl-tRNA synthetase
MVTRAKVPEAEWPVVAAELGLTGAGRGDDGQGAALRTAPAGAMDGGDAIVARLAAVGAGGPDVTFRLRDWLISRQRYWGTPIPVIHCAACGAVPVPEDQLPVTLPEDVAFKPTGESPLRFADAWRIVTCPACGGRAERDTDTMDTFVDSSWYHYRYLSPHYDQGPFDPAASEWLPVAQYTGGIEHATMHLLYTRFWTKAMRDAGLVSFDEPMLRLFTQGTILGEDSEKMSKSRGNVEDPDALVATYGADAIRAYLMFIGPWDHGGPWDSRGVLGVVRWLNDVWDLATPRERHAAPADFDETVLLRPVHQTLMAVTEDLDAFRFNTAIAELMALRNVLKEHRDRSGTPAWAEAIRLYLLMMAPITPHIAEELWVSRGHPYSIHLQPWPTHDASVAREAIVEIAVQVSGRLRDRISLAVDASQADAVAAAMQSGHVQRALDGATPARIVFVPGRLLNLVV